MASLRRSRVPRASIACESCRKLKAKCDQNMPCKACTRNSFDCVYRAPRRRKETNTRVDRLRANVAKIAPWPNSSPDTPINRATGNAPMTLTNVALLEGSKGESYPRQSALSDTGEDTAFLPGQGAPLVTLTGRHHGPHSQEPVRRGFGEVNKRTNGKEFYGPAATLAFLLELKRCAHIYQQQLKKRRPQVGGVRDASQLEDSSIVNFLHGDDDPLLGTATPEDTGDDDTESAAPIQDVDLPVNHEIEKECIDSFFANLHLIYHFLDRQSFETRCNAEIWSHRPSTSLGTHKSGSRFPALYNAVVAVGALTAGDESEDRMRAFLDQHYRPRLRKPGYGQFWLASIYFAKAKRLLGDMFESCCLESQQTLLLMSILCQYALKPHGAYMYSGMSTRTALAMGSANEPDLKKNPLEAVQTWWWSYYHEIEVCCSLGRDTCVREPTYYPVYVAKLGEPMPQGFGQDDDHDLFFARCTTEMADILRQTFEQIYHSTKSIHDKVQDAVELDNRLLAWKSQLAPIFDLSSTSLIEREHVTKRKVILKLRFFSARILIHRSFLLNTPFSETPYIFASNIDFCLSAARETIHLLYDTFINRPSLRTWWYNTTYAFNAIIIILYVLFSRLQSGSGEDFFKDVEKTLSIFRAMDGISVARRCAELTEEVFAIAKSSIRQQASSADVSPDIEEGVSRQMGDDGSVADVRTQASAWKPSQNLETISSQPPTEVDNLRDDFFTHILDDEFLDNFDANLSAMDFDGSPFELRDMDWGVA